MGTFNYLGVSLSHKVYIIHSVNILLLSCLTLCGDGVWRQRVGKGHLIGRDRGVVGDEEVGVHGVFNLFHRCYKISIETDS